MVSKVSSRSHQLPVVIMEFCITHFPIRYLKYGQGSKRCPIQDVLESTLTFVHSTPPSSDELNSDVDMKTPISGSPTPMHTNNPSPSPCPLSEVRWSPTPRHVTETEVAVMEECLRRWRHEMEQDVKGIVDCTFDGVSGKKP